MPVGTAADGPSDRARERAPARPASRNSARAAAAPMTPGCDKERECMMAQRAKGCSRAAMLTRML
eukprot:2246361-Lingulodinium_polyedra.AAC.1